MFFAKILLSRSDSIAKRLYVFFFVLSILSSFHLDIDINEKLTLMNIVNSSFILGSLIIIIDSFKNYTKISFVEMITLSPFQKLIIQGITFLGVVAFFFNIILVYGIFNFQSTTQLTIDVIKNEFVADVFYRSNYPRFVRTYTHFVSPFGYLFLSLHFFFLGKDNFKLVILYGILSLIIPLHGMQGLSRAAPAQYILLYYFMYYYVSDSFSIRTRKKFSFYMRLVTGLIGTSFLITSYIRFSDNYFYVNLLGSDSSVVWMICYSFIDYLTQWIPLGIDSLNYYNQGVDLVFSNFRPLFNYITEALGMDFSYDLDHFRNIYGGYTSKFIGLIPTLIFDMGYFLTFLFILLYRGLIFSKNKTKTICFTRLVKLPLFLSLIIMAFANAWLAYLLFHMALIYTVMAFWFFKFKIKYRV